MYRWNMELANELDIIPAEANSPPQNVTARCEISLHSRQDSEPAMKNVRWNVAGIHRQPTTDRFSNSSLWTSTNPSRTSGPKDLNMPGNRKLANAQPPTTYQAQLSSNVRCWCLCSGFWWCWPRMVDDGDDLLSLSMYDDSSGSDLESPASGSLQLTIVSFAISGV